MEMRAFFERIKIQAVCANFTLKYPIVKLQLK